MIDPISSAQRRLCAPAPAAVLLLVLCLFAGGAQAANTFAPNPGVHPVPGQVLAENYDLGGEGIVYYDPSGYDVGWVRTGEYLAYEVYVAEGGTYEMTARVATSNSGRTIVLSVFNETLATVMVPNTGSFDAFKTVSVPVTLTSGFHPLRLTFQGDGLNLDWIAFALAGPGSPRGSPPSSREGAGRSL